MFLLDCLAETIFKGILHGQLAIGADGKGIVERDTMFTKQDSGDFLGRKFSFSFHTSYWPDFTVCGAIGHE